MMTNEEFCAELTRLIKDIDHSEEHKWTRYLLMECRERIDGIKHLESEMQYFRELNAGYEKVFAELTDKERGMKR
jgi:hypothetical protein